METLVNRINDAELVLYFYRDQLSRERVRQIADALASNSALSARYAMLCSTLQASDLDQPPAPAPGFDDRLWLAIEPRLARDEGSRVGCPAEPRAAAPDKLIHSIRSRRRRRNRFPWKSIAAACLVLAGGVFIGRVSQPGLPTPSATDVAPSSVATSDVSARQRVLDAYLAEHLSGASRVIRVAEHGGGEQFAAGNAALARALLADHRLYQAAAERAGDLQMASLLQSIEPVLIELANPTGKDDIQLRKGLSGFLQRSDLAFEVRASEASVESRRTATL